MEKHSCKSCEYYQELVPELEGGDAIISDRCSYLPSFEDRKAFGANEIDFYVARPEIITPIDKSNYCEYYKEG